MSTPLEIHNIELNNTAITNRILSSVIVDPENRLLLEALEHFANVLRRYGIKVAPYSEMSLLKLAEVPVEKKRGIRSLFENWAQWIAPDSDGADILEVDLEKEKLFLKRALDHYGVWIHDDFWSSLRKGHLIEVYGQEMIQIYRNIEFFKYCSYTLLDISIFEWYSLWERPRSVFEMIMDVARSVLVKQTPITKFKVPQHVLREVRPPNRENGEQRMACLVTLECIGSLYRGLSRQPAGAIATSVGEIIAIGDEARKIQFV